MNVLRRAMILRPATLALSNSRQISTSLCAFSLHRDEELVSKLADKDLFKVHGFIGGKWTEAEDGASLEVFNPATNAVIAKVASSGAKETQKAIQAASQALPAWRAKTGKERGQILRKWYDAVVAASEDIAHIMTAECGKPVAEAKGECLQGAASIDWFAEEGRRIYGDVLQSTNPDLRMVTIKEPVGVVAAITPWNFPMSMITRKISPAIAAGCTVVLKPAEATPLSALALAELARRSGIPDGVVNIVVGEAKPIGETLMASDVVRKIGFTGSTRVGKMLFAQAADTVKKVSLELGGNAPFIVFDDADLEAAASSLVASAFRNAGQTCICANRVLVQDGVYDEFTKIVTAKVEQFHQGDGSQEGINLGPLINPAAVDRVEEHVNDATSKGGKILTGGNRPQFEGPTSKGYFFEPTVISEATTDMRIFKEETFGPAIPCFRFKEDSEAVKMANDTEYGLAAYFYTKDLARAWKAAEGIEYGMIGVNESTIGSEVAPFGGLKHSGLGKELSKYGIDEFVNIKYVCFGVGYNKSL